MAGRLIIACVSSLAVLAFLLLFGSASHVDAVTYKMGYSTEFSCDGPDRHHNPMECDLNGDGDCADAGELDVCDDAIDDDADTLINDGCPIVGSNGENPACINNLDDDPTDDGLTPRVNDGCPAKDTDDCDLTDDAGTGPPDGDCDDPGEAGLCINALDDDGDTRVNDGCPTVGNPESDECVNAIDDDPGDDGATPTVNDGCKWYDDSCVEDPTYGANGAGLHADLVSMFSVPLADPKYSNYELLATMGTPSTWQISLDKEIPNGAYIGDMYAESTLGLFGTACDLTQPVLIHMYDCSTDITNTIEWDGPNSGKNLTYGHQGGLPAGCMKYPAHVLEIIGNVQPRARYYGFTTVINGMPPTQLQFMMFNPEQLSSLPTQPQADFIDDLGYINFTVLDNPLIPADPSSALDEFCTPLGTTTTLYGRTAGEGALTQDIFAPDEVPAAAGTFWKVGSQEGDTHDPATFKGEYCGNDVDDDGDTRVDEMCGIVRVTNPAANSGVYGTGSHLAGGYSESYRDADGDTIPNNEDECPCQADTYTGGVWDDADGDFINDVCDPTNNPCTMCDEDNDGWRNQADSCPLVTALECEWAGDTDNDGNCNTAGELAFCADALDNDSDGFVNDGCPKVGTVAETGSECEDAVDAGEDDPDDGVANDGCPIANHLDTDEDSIGDDCDVGAYVCTGDANTPDGDFLNDFAVGSICIGEADTDGDGWCDTTEGVVGTAVEALADPSDPDETPEYYGTDFTVRNDRDGDTVLDAAPQTCDNYDYYDVNSGNPHGGVGLGIDDDGDTVINANDPNCTCNTATDADCDGVPDTTDNCTNDANPTQLDTDGDCTIPAAAVNNCGDACDSNDDNDRLTDVKEWQEGSDPKNVCDPVSFDLKRDGKITILDVSAFANPMKIPAPAYCNPPADYTICEATYRSDP